MKKRALEILDRVLAQFGVAAKWEGSRFGSVKMVGATNVGQVGERFAVAMLADSGYKAEQNPKRRDEWDIRANGKTMEVKCASEDVHGRFQFNGIRYDTRYDFLLVVGVAPETVWFRFYKRQDLMDFKMAPMARGTAGSYKLSRRPDQLFSIDKFADEAAKFIGEPSAALPRP